MKHDITINTKAFWRILKLLFSEKMVTQSNIDLMEKENVLMVGDD